MRTGGKVFEHYLSVFASYASHRAWISHLTKVEAGERHDLLPHDEEKQIIKRERSKFHGWIMSSCNSIGNMGKKQLFFSSFVARYHGLSRGGLEILAQFGFASSKTMYGDLYREQITLAKEAAQEVATRPHVVWLDNFSKIYGRQMPNIDIGAWADCLWTGEAFRAYTGTVPVSMSIMYNEGDIVPAMPDDLFDKESEFKACWEGALADLTYRAKSKLVKWSIRTVPIKPDATLAVEKIRWRNALKSDCSSLKTLYPHRIIRKNIGSNKGLAEIMRDHYTSNGQDVEGKCDKYSAFIVDENIYMRILKVHTHKKKGNRKKT